MKDNIVNAVVESKVASILNKAAGFILQPSTNRKEASEYLCKEIGKLDHLPPLARAAMKSEADRIIREYINQNSVVELALNELAKSSTDEIPDRNDDSFDFIYKILNQVRNISSVDLQKFWATALTDELISPGAVPRHLISILSGLTPTQAHQLEVLSLFLAYKIHGNTRFGHPALVIPKYLMPLSVWYTQDDKDVGCPIDIATLLDFHSLGVLVYGIKSVINVYHKFEIDIRIVSLSENKRYTICPICDTQTDEIEGFYTGDVALTSAGQYLFENIIGDVSLDKYHFQREKATQNIVYLMDKQLESCFPNSIVSKTHIC